MPAPAAPLTVSDVRTALACPRLFHLSRAGGGPTLFGRARAIAVGRRFHEAMAGLARLAPHAPEIAAALEPAAPDAERVARALERLLYERELFPTLAREWDTLGREPAAVLDLWASLRNAARLLATRLVANRAHYAPREVASHTIVIGELDVRAAIATAEGDVELGGRVDAVFYDRGRAEITLAEYKTVEPVNRSLDVTQVALYAWVLREVHKVPAASAVLYFLPEAREERISDQELSAAMRACVPGLFERMLRWARWTPADGTASIPGPTDLRLCSLCPQRARCEDRFGPWAGGAAPVSRQPPPIATAPATPAADDEARTRLANLVAVLSAFKVPVEPAGHEVGPRFLRLKVLPRPPITVRQIENKAGDLQVHLNLDRPPVVQGRSGCVSVDVRRSAPDAVPLLPLLAGLGPAPRRGLSFPLGRGIGGEVATIDLAEHNTCHLLIGGETGSGKSGLLRSIVVALAHRYSPARVRLVLIDPKLVTFTRLAFLPHLHSPIVTDIDRAIGLLNELVEEMDRRYERLEAARVDDIAALAETGSASDAPPRIVVVFDEFADFMVQRETRNALEDAVKRLGSKARAAGIHLVLATQRPDRTVVTGLIKANLPCRIALRTGSAIDSQIILEDGSAARLLGEGDLFLLRAGGDLVRLQAPWVSAAELEAWLAATAGPAAAAR